MEIFQAGQLLATKGNLTLSRIKVVFKNIGITFLLTLFLSNYCNAQHFEWAASASNIDLSYTFSSVDIYNNLVVGGEGNRNYTHQGDTEIYDGKGEIVKMSVSINEMNLILSYSPEGDINWTYPLYKRHSELFGITHDGEGNTVLLVKLNRIKKDENGISVGTIPQIHHYDYIPTGYYLMYLDEEGQYLKMNRIFQGEYSNKLAISTFQSYTNGGFVLTGFIRPGKLCDELEVNAGKGGGDFVLVLDEEGHPNWADIISYEKENCGSLTIFAKVV